MTAPGMGHNGGPEFDGRKVSIRTAWAKALFNDPDTPTYVIAMAWAIHWYTRADGSGAILSNEQFMTICGISEPTATRGKRWLRDKGYVCLQGGKGDQKTQFQMLIPDRRVITQTTQQETTPGHQAEGSQPLGTPTDDRGNQTDDSGVIPRLVYNQDKNSRIIQEKPRAPSRKEKPQVSYWQQALNPAASEGIEFIDGQLKLVNGVRADWLNRFGGDADRLDLALKEVAPFLQPNSNKPLLIQLEGKLAKIVGEMRDRDARYEKAANKRPTKGISQLKAKFLKATGEKRDER